MGDSDSDLGHTSVVQQKIPLIDDTPFKERRVHPGMLDEVREHIKRMLDTGVIRESQSLWASPPEMARKKDGSLRFCVDY